MTKIPAIVEIGSRCLKCNHVFKKNEKVHFTVNREKLTSLDLLDSNKKSLNGHEIIMLCPKCYGKIEIKSVFLKQ